VFIRHLIEIADARVLPEYFQHCHEDKFEHRYFLDLFAGPGLCCNRDEWDNSRRFINHGNKTELALHQLYFVDLNKNITDILKARCNAIRPELKDAISFKNQDTNQDIDTILNSITRTNSISVAFLDPTGLDINFSTLEKLSRFPRMDIIINFSISDLRRNLKLYRVSNPRQMSVSEARIGPKKILLSVIRTYFASWDSMPWRMMSKVQLMLGQYTI